MTVNVQSHMITAPDGDQLHLRRYRSTDRASVPVMLLHGLHEDGTVFYSRTGRGLAPYLARHGADVLVPDLRGRGRSWPGIEQRPDYDVCKVVTEDLPLLAEAAERLCGQVAPVWIAHGAGGVLLSAFLARYPEFCTHLKGVVYFGSCRRFMAGEYWQNRLLTGLWGPVTDWVARLLGAVPAPLLGLGVQNESLALHRTLLSWSQGAPWRDPGDQFDYAQAWEHGATHPPVLYFATRGRVGFGSATAVTAFMRELGRHDGRLVVLGRQGGNLHNYTHISMLTHEDAERDHFPFMLRWIQDRAGLQQDEAVTAQGLDSANHVTATDPS